MKLATSTLLLAAVLALAGCAKPEKPGPTGGPGTPAAKKQHDHSHWWCAEHGIPEEECSMCLPAAKVKTMFKDKGDWCDQHQRAKSQCFICDPKLKDVFAAKYRAKFPGKEPPPIEE